jgi:SHS2 domain-containing protein
MYEIFEHTADLGLRVRAGSLSGLFADAARGLFAMVVTNLDEVHPVEKRTYRLEGDERDLLLFDWLNELLYTCETERLLLSEFAVDLNETADGRLTLAAECHGEKIDESRHRLEHEVKAITYHGLLVTERDGEWLAEVIVDI